MKKDIYLKKKLTASWFSLLQEIICYEFEKIEYPIIMESEIDMVDHNKEDK